MANFQTGLFGCFEDFGICITTYFCPQYQNAKNRTMIDGRECGFCDCWFSLLAHPAVLAYFDRQSIRAKFQYEMNPCLDCLVVYFCSPCAICQHARELQSKGAGLSR